jgi:hypothetical protein
MIRRLTSGCVHIENPPVQDKYSGVTKEGANEKLPISFGDLSSVILISKLLPIEILLFQNCLFIFE